MIGVGEFEGKILTSEDLEKSTPRGSDLRSELSGKSADELVSALKSAQQHEQLAEQLKAAESDC